MSQHHAFVLVHGPVELDGCAIVAIGQFVCTLHAHVLGTSFGLGLAENITEDDTSPESGGYASRTPREAFCLPDDVLFFPSVTSTDERDGVCVLLILFQQIGEGHGDGVFDHAFDRKGPVGNGIVLDLWNMAMVTNVEQLGTCQEAFVVEVGKGCFDIEGMYTSETNQSRVSR